MTRPFKALFVLWIGVVALSASIFWAFVTYGPAWTKAVVDRNPGYHLLEGRTLMEKGDLIQAEVHLRRAVELSPGDPGYWRELGLCLSRQKKYSEAIPCFEKAREVLPTYIKSHPEYDMNDLLSRYCMDLARQYDAMGDYIHAIPYGEQAVSLSPVGALRTEHLLTLCAILMRAEDYPRLADFSLQLLKVSPGPLSHRYRALALMKSGGDLNEALESAHTACAAEDAHPDDFHILGLIQEKLGNIPAAYDAMKKALSRDADNARSVFEVARMARLTGDEESALKYAENLRRMAQGDSVAATLLNELIPGNLVLPATGTIAPKDAPSASDTITSASNP